MEGCAPAGRAEDCVGAGFTGVKGHKPPGFSLTSKCRAEWTRETWAHEIICSGPVSKNVKSLQGKVFTGRKRKRKKERNVSV